MGKINGILEKERPTQRYREYMEKWIPKEMLKDFRTVYDTKFLNSN
jgi:hypothetical protein